MNAKEYAETMAKPKTETAPLAKAVTVQKQPAKKKPGRPKKFDEGKVIALFKAGWSVVDIAADMNTEPERIEAIVINAHVREDAA